MTRRLCVFRVGRQLDLGEMLSRMGTFGRLMIVGAFAFDQLCILHFTFSHCLLCMRRGGGGHSGWSCCSGRRVPPTLLLFPTTAAAAATTMLLRLRASESLRVGGSLPVVGRVPYQADQKIRDLGPQPRSSCDPVDCEGCERLGNWSAANMRGEFSCQV